MLLLLMSPLIQYVKETPYLVGPIRMNVGSGCNFCPTSSTDDLGLYLGLLLTLAELHHTCNLYIAQSDQTTHCSVESGKVGSQ